PIRLLAARRVEERHEYVVVRVAFEGVRGKGAGDALDLEAEGPGAFGRLELPVGRRDREHRRLGAGVWLECQPVAAQRLVDGVVGQPLEFAALRLRQGAASARAEEFVLV